MELGRTSAGVPMSTRICGAAKTPTMVKNRPQAIPKAAVVWIDSLSRSISLAPKCLAMTTPAPTAIPLKKPTIRKIRLLEELTAARAAFPIKLPTIRESTVL